MGAGRRDGPAAGKQRPAVVKQHDLVAKQAPPLLGMASHGSCCDTIRRQCIEAPGLMRSHPASQLPGGPQRRRGQIYHIAPILPTPLGCSAAAASSAPGVTQRVPQDPVGLPAGQRAAGIGGIQAEDHPHHDGLPRPVGLEKPVTCSGSPVNDIPSSATVGANLLRWPLTSVGAAMPGRLGTGGGGVVTPGSRLRRRWKGDFSGTHPSEGTARSLAGQSDASAPGHRRQ